MFWVDLSTASLIDGSFNTAMPNQHSIVTVSGSAVGQYFPQAKIGSNGYVYVWSGGYQGAGGQLGDLTNYFAVENVTGTITNAGIDGRPASLPLMTVAQAYAVDSKMDDGLPQSGNVTAMTATYNNVGSLWVSSGTTGTRNGALYETVRGDYDTTTYGPITSATTSAYYTDQHGSSSQTCYSNGDTLATEQYSIVNNANYVNCALSFKFQ